MIRAPYYIMPVLLCMAHTTCALPDHIPHDNEPIVAPDIHVPHYQDHTQLLNGLLGPIVAIGGIEIVGTSGYADTLTTPIPWFAITCCLNSNVHNKLTGAWSHAGYLMYSLVLYGIYQRYVEETTPDMPRDPRIQAIAGSIWGELFACGITALQ